LVLTKKMLGRRFRRVGTPGPTYAVIGRYYPRRLDPDRPPHEMGWVLQDPRSEADRITVLESELKNRDRWEAVADTVES
jgi:hypothetical protein